MTTPLALEEGLCVPQKNTNRQPPKVGLTKGRLVKILTDEIRQINAKEAPKDITVAIKVSICGVLCCLTSLFAVAVVKYLNYIDPPPILGGAFCLASAAGLCQISYLTLFDHAKGDKRIITGEAKRMIREVYDLDNNQLLDPVHFMHLKHLTYFSSSTQKKFLQQLNKRQFLWLRINNDKKLTQLLRPQMTKSQLKIVNSLPRYNLATNV